MNPVSREVDPLTGVVTEYAFKDGKLYQRTTSDTAAAHLDYSRTLANDPAYSAHGIKNNMWHTGHVPPDVIVKWLGEGFNAYTAHPDEILARLRTPEYAYLRTTSRRF